MPIYQMKCNNPKCLLEKEELLSIHTESTIPCPSCHQDTYTKQLTAPGTIDIQGFSYANGYSRG